MHFPLHLGIKCILALAHFIQKNTVGKFRKQKLANRNQENGSQNISKEM